MTPREHEQERELRAAAIRRADGACDVLADFYEERQQHSRAALWRATINGERDLLVKNHDNLHTVDPKRNAMIWLLVEVGSILFARWMTTRTIAARFDLSKSHILNIHARAWYKLGCRAYDEIRKPTMAATQRLIAAGALPTFDPKMTPTTIFGQDDELVPDDWPAVHNVRLDGRTYIQRSSPR